MCKSKSSYDALHAVLLTLCVTQKEDEQRSDKGSNTWGRYINKYISFVQKLPTTSIFSSSQNYIFISETLFSFLEIRWGGRTVRLLIIISPLIISWRNYTKDDRKNEMFTNILVVAFLPIVDGFLVKFLLTVCWKDFYFLISCYLDIYTTKHKRTAVKDDPWLFFCIFCVSKIPCNPVRCVWF